MKKLINIIIIFIVSQIFTSCSPATPTLDELLPAAASDPILRFLADRNAVTAGECTELTWEVQQDFKVTINDEVVSPSGQMMICPLTTTAYQIIASKDDSKFDRIIEVMILDSPPTVEPEQTPEQIVPGTPAYMSEAWEHLGGPPGGLGYDIRMVPDNPDIMYVTDANAGIFKSIDGGKTWLPVNNGISSFSAYQYPVFSATIDPFNYDHIWIGTQFSGQIYLSENAGESWQEKFKVKFYEGYSVRGITVDPNNPDIIYAGVEVASWDWNGEPITKRFDLTKGEVYKSVDHGNTWKSIWTGDNLARYVWVDPRNSNRVYVSTGIFDRDAANSDIPNGVWGGVGILRSDDAGQTWTVLNEKNGLGGLYVPSLFMHPENPDILLAAVTGTGDIPGVYLTRDGGDTWKLVLEMPAGFGAEAVEISESNPSVWYAASESIIWRSDDAGDSWQNYRMGTQDRDAGLPIDLQVDPRDPMRIFVNNYGGGNFVSENGGETWVDASKGYTGSKPYSVGVTPGTNALVFTTSFYSNDAGDTWRGEGTPVFSSIQFFTNADDGKQYVIGGAGESIFISPTSDIQWTPTKLVDQVEEMRAGRIINERMLVKGLAVAPSNPRVMYAGFADGYCAKRAWQSCFDPTPGFFHSNDYGKTWNKTSPIPNNHASILNIVVDPNDDQLIYVATGSGLFLSKDGGDSWEQLTGLDAVTNKVTVFDKGTIPTGNSSMVFDIRIDPFDSNTLYAASMPGTIFKSVDHGKIWKQIASGMDPNEPITAIVPDPVHQGVIYASSELSGLFYSTDSGERWLAFSDGLSFKRIFAMDLSADGSTLYAAMNGAGIFRLGNPGE